ncbi:MAG: MMPL family transporter, partial [candidate division Zixibacteria bacterium]
IRYSFDTVGAAMWITTITLVAGFMVLSLSGFKQNSDMGLLTAITITLALAMDFFFLPALLLRVERKTTAQIRLTKEKNNEVLNSDYRPAAVAIDSKHISSDA